MKVAIIYKSKIGNTKLLAASFSKFFSNQVVYKGDVQENINADLYFISSWTYRGNCVEEISNYLKSLSNKKIIYFGTCGFGGSTNYYESIFKRVNLCINNSNQVLGYFICQGKMPLSVREKYLQSLVKGLLNQKTKLSIENFDRALTHPDKKDLTELNLFLERIIKNI